MTNQQIAVLLTNTYLMGIIVLVGIVFGAGWAFIPLTLAFLIHLGAN